MIFHQVTVHVKPVYTPPQLFPIGIQAITYIATDSSGNQANCSFTVTVIGESHLPGDAQQCEGYWSIADQMQKSFWDTFQTPFT